MNIEKNHLENLLPFCSRHQGIPVQFGCIHLECQYCILLCPECINEDEDHVQKHRTFILDFKTFTKSLSQEIGHSTKNYGIFLTNAFEKLYNNELLMLKTLNDFVEKEKKKLISEMSDLLTLIVEKFEIIKMDLIVFLDLQFSNFQKNIQNFKSEFQKFNPKDNYQQFSDPLNIKKKILYKSPIQTLHFLTYLRKYANQESDLIKSLTNFADKIKFHYENPPHVPNVIFSNLREETENLFQRIKNNINNSITAIPYFSENFFQNTSENLLSPDHKNYLFTTKHNMPDYKYHFEFENIVLTNHNNSISQLVAITDEIVATSSFDRTIKIWKINDSEPIFVIRDINSVCSLTVAYGVKIMRKKNKFLTSQIFQRIKGQWNHNENSLKGKEIGFDNSLEPLHSISQEIYLLSGGFDRRVKLWDFNLNSKGSSEISEPYKIYLTQNSWITILKSLEDGINFISGDDTGEMVIFNILTGEVKARLALHNKFITGIKILEPFRSMITYSGNTFRVWRLVYDKENSIKDLDQVYCEKTIIHTSEIYTISNCTFYSNYLFISGSEGIVVIYDLDNNSYIHAFKSTTPKENYGDFLVLENKATILIENDSSFGVVNQNNSGILTKSQLMRSKTHLKPLKPPFMTKPEHNQVSMFQKIVLLVVGLRNIKIIDLNGNVLAYLNPSESHEDFSFHNILSGRNIQLIKFENGFIYFAIASQFSNQHLDYKSARISIIKLQLKID